MKQHVTIDQLNGLSEKGKQRLREWWRPGQGDIVSVHGITMSTDLPSVDGKYHKEYGWYTSTSSGTEKALPLLSIGQLIEFLEENDRYGVGTRNEGINDWVYCFIDNENSNYEEMEFDKSKLRNPCDALWSTCVEVLEK